MDNHGTRRYGGAMRWLAGIVLYIVLFFAVAYSRNDAAQVLFLVLTAAMVALGVLYALTRFVAWAARR